MNLIAPKGHRTALSPKEVCKHLGMTAAQIRWYVRTGKLLKRFDGPFPFDLTDVNKFILEVNNGMLHKKRGERRTA